MLQRLILLLAIGVLGCLPGLAAAQPRVITPAEQAAIGEMTDLFDRYCLRAFPDEQAIGQLAQSSMYKPMTVDGVKTYLHEDPGQGWVFKTSIATYVLTVEHPPFRACALRRMTGEGIPSIAPFVKAIDSYGAQKKEDLKPIPNLHQTAPNGIELFAVGKSWIPPGTQAPRDVFMVILSNYHGHRPNGELADDVPAGSAGVEVRFVHQLPPPK